MRTMDWKFAAAWLLASGLAFVGCGTDMSKARMEPGMGGPGTENISLTKQSDDNLRMPREDPLRTREQESIREAWREPGVPDYDTGAGTGGSGLDSGESVDEPMDEPSYEPPYEPLNEGGNLGGYTRVPDSPADTVPESLLRH